jgi:hypothetical protein
MSRLRQDVSHRTGASAARLSWSMPKVLLSPATLVGASLAAALLLAAWLGAFTGPQPSPARSAAAPPTTSSPAVDAVPVPAARPAAASQPSGPAAPAMRQLPVAVAASCPATPLSSPQGAADGRFALEAALAAGARVEPSAYFAVSREAAQQGRLRDAEVALLAACHLAEKASGPGTVAMADAKTRIAQQYVTLAATQPAGGARDVLLQRAATLLSESAITYSAALGREASKTRLAEQRLASLREPATLRRARVVAAAETGTRAMGAAPNSSSDPRFAPDARAARTAPAMRSLIASDPQLAQLERDMQRLRAQASRVSRDPNGLRQRDSYALARRDAACQDKGCLLQWYAQRRRQLLDEF